MFQLSPQGKNGTDDQKENISHSEKSEGKLERQNEKFFELNSVVGNPIVLWVLLCT